MVYLWFYYTYYMFYVDDYTTNLAEVCVAAVSVSIRLSRISS